METLERLCGTWHQKDIFLNFLRNEKHIDDKIFKIKNDNPRKRKKFILTAQLKMKDENDFCFSSGRSENIPNFCELKFRTIKNFRLISSGLSFKFRLERVSAEEMQREEHLLENGGSGTNTYAQRVFRNLVSSDSEIDLEKPEAMNDRYYNHNGLLSSKTCKLKSRRVLRKFRKY